MGGSALLLCAIPAFGASLIEDVTKPVSPRNRLLASGVSEAIAVDLLGAVNTRTEIPGLDFAVSFAALAAVVTISTVTAIANSVNIIDCFNGMVSMCVVIMFAAVADVVF